MLLPFSQRHLAIPKSHPAFMPVVARDMLEMDAEFQGYLQVVNDNRAYTLLVAGGGPTHHALYTPNDGWLHPLRIPRDQAVEQMGNEGAMLVMATDQVLTSLLSVMLSRMPDMVLPVRLLEPDRLIEEITARTDLFVLNPVERHIAQPAVFVQGEMQLWYRFDAERHEFVVEHDLDALLEKLLTLEESASVWCYEDPTPDLVIPPDTPGKRDAFRHTLHQYLALFDHIREAMFDPPADTTVAAMQQLLSGFKRKYPPLYRGVYINPETNHINWHFFDENRIRLSARYRYDMFFLYMDELLLALIKKLYEIKRVRGIMELIQYVGEMKTRSGNAPDYFERILFAKLDSLLKTR